MAFQLHDFKAAASYICEGKLERTKPFYVEQFEALKALTSSEVSQTSAPHSPADLKNFPGARTSQTHRVRTGVVPPSPRSLCL